MDHIVSVPSFISFRKDLEVIGIFVEGGAKKPILSSKKPAWVRFKDSIIGNNYAL